MNLPVRKLLPRIAQLDSQQPPVSPFLIDSFRRRHDYLRISLTERCNLRCFYCMPEEGIELSPNGKLMTDDEVVRLATLFVKNGVTKIRLTGGEPTVRKGLVDLVGRLNELRDHGLQAIGMTTNGIALHRRLPALVQNGLTHLNISLDTLDPFKFEIMTRRRGHDAVLKSIDTALASSELRSVKLNVVVIKGLNDGEVLDFLEMTKDQALSVRFIEFMPFTGNKWDKAKMLPSSQLLARIEEKHPLVMKVSDELNDTARNYLIPGYQGSFGFISSMSDHFCGSCNRLRLTADGQIKVCLFDAKEISLRDQMRQGASDEELTQTIGRAVGAKKEKHAGMEDIDVVTNRPMILIGGALYHAQSNIFTKGLSQINARADAGFTTRIQARRDSRKANLLGFGLPYSRSRRRHEEASSSYTGARLPQEHIRFSSTSSNAAGASQTRLTHIDETGRPTMVDVSPKTPTKRTATASGRIYVPKIAYELITTSKLSEDIDRTVSPSDEVEKAKAKARSKGDVLTVAQLAAIMGCKRTADLIPLCHPLALTNVSVRLLPEHHPQPRTGPASNDGPPSQYSVMCQATVSCEGKTGVEMEALTAVSVGLLTVWDMLKAVAGREMVIGEIVVDRKEGGKSGDFVRSHSRR
ncbi:molybdenum cofactor biosynthesis prote [Cristinia sonorae]|uniref:Molybdenum cofactor biosynthesis prote n=1 Tax=Cristinia sonorae TaxID=1940300 RepID=A0A8K0ULN0_9AGAR|nr:molybdenum cofactor biosynthesis prote [Cristinia sonorae]